MFKTWIRGAATALGMVGASWHATADTSNYQVYTNSAGDIYLKAPEQFVLIHADVSVPLHVMPADGYLKVLRNSDGSWTTTAISAAEWNSLGLFQGGNTVDSLRYQDMNGDGTLDMFLRLSDGRYLIIYREKNGQFKTKGSGDVKIGASYELRDVNGDGYLDVVSDGTVVSYGLPQYSAIYLRYPQKLYR